MSGNNAFRFALLSALVSVSALRGSDNACSPALSADPETFLCPDRGFSLLLPRTPAPKSLLFVVEHRANSPAFANPLRDALGLDNGSLKIGLGLRYAPFERLDIGVRRINNGLDLFDTYEFDGRYCPFRETAQGIDAAIDAGFSLFAQEVHGMASGVFASVVAGRHFFNRVYGAGGAQYHSNSTWLSKKTSDTDWGLCIPLGFHVRVIGGLTLLTEWFFPAAGYSAGRPGYAAGFTFATWRHRFSLLLTNTPYTTADGTVSGSGRMNDPVLGFMIVRQFGGE
ncbi:MAG: hypothetical protein JXA71_09295 [Chitinispirillaceae bacterium]|nr:hypothetical protein [Chitinispirillaceae bacterium]